MDTRIPQIGSVSFPLNFNSYLEIAVPDVSSSTGYTSRKIKLGELLWYKFYKGLISQASGAAPSVVSNGSGANTPFINSVGALTYTRIASGVYEVTSAGLFTLNKTFVTIQATSAAAVGSLITVEHLDVNTLSITTVNSAGSNVDDVLNNTPFQIEVYP